MLLIVALVLRIVFLRSNEIHGPVAGIVFMTVHAPILCVSGRYMQINRRRRRCLRLDQHGLRVDDRRRTFVAEIHLTVQAGRHLARQHDVNIQAARVTETRADE
jgi:hypothetical protein